MKVLLAQLRKPPCETRFHDRIGLTMAATGWKVVSAGAIIPTKIASGNNSVQVKAIFPAEKNGINFILNLQRMAELVIKENPDLLIFCNPEAGLLLPLLKVLKPGLKVIFDLQENHCLNIKKQQHPHPARWIYALAAEILVQTSCLFANRIWFAEEIYHKQIPLPASKSICISNKPSIYTQNISLHSENKRRFAFTGFITRESGIMRAIRFIEILRETNPDWSLKVCGYCPDARLRKEITSYAFVDYPNSDTWAGQSDIGECHASASGLLMPYIETEANYGKTPSKWFLARSSGIPVVYNAGSSLNLPEASSLGFALDFEFPEPDFEKRWDEFRDQYQPIPVEKKDFFDEETVSNEILRIFGSDFSGFQ